MTRLQIEQVLEERLLLVKLLKTEEEWDFFLFKEEMIGSDEISRLWRWCSFPVIRLVLCVWLTQKYLLSLLRSSWAFSFRSPIGINIVEITWFLFISDTLNIVNEKH